MRQYFRSYWFWFFLALALVSTWDFIAHMSYEESYFRNIWVKWLIFTICSTAAICVCIYYLNFILSKLFKTDSLGTQSVAIVLAMLVHIYVSGPILEKVIIGQRNLYFKFNPIALAIGLAIFYIIRILTYVGLRISSKKTR